MCVSPFVDPSRYFTALPTSTLASQSIASRKSNSNMAAQNSPGGRSLLSDRQSGCILALGISALIVSFVGIAFHAALSSEVKKIETLIASYSQRLSELESGKLPRRPFRFQEEEVKVDGHLFNSGSYHKASRKRRNANNGHRRRQVTDNLMSEHVSLSNRLSQIEAFLRHKRSNTAVHVVASQSHRTPRLHSGRLLWQHFSGRVFDADDFEFDENYTSLTAKTPGLFLINVQITFNGRAYQSITSSPCSFVVKRCEAGSNGTCADYPRMLMYGATTQYKLGQMIQFSDSGIYAYDSVFTSQVVELRLHDKVFVELIPPACTVLTHEEKTYLEMVLIRRD